MLNETSSCPGWMTSFIYLRVVTLNSVQVMNQFSDLRFMIKQFSPFFLGTKKICEESLVPWANFYGALRQHWSDLWGHHSLLSPWYIYLALVGRFYLRGLLLELQHMPEYCAQHKEILGYIYPLVYTFPQSPCHGKELMVLHDLGSRLFGSGMVVLEYHLLVLLPTNGITC